MSDPVDLRDLLDKTSLDFPDRPNLPGSKYFYGRLVKMSSILSTKKETPGYQFDIRITDPGKDVSPVDMAAIRDAGFTLADYDCNTTLWLTKAAMPRMRRFLDSLGFDPNKTFREKLALDEKFNPTDRSQELIRGKEIMFQTPAADDQGRVFLNGVDNVTGIKKD